MVSTFNAGTAAAGSSQSYRFRYHGEGGAFFLLLLKNVFLSLITLGIYTPWAKVARRRYIWGNVDFHGQRLSFTGTGAELFIGYLKVGLVLIVLYGPSFAAAAMKEFQLQQVLSLLAALVLLVIAPFAIYRSRAYILSRTRWRGIRLGLTGSAGPYMKAFIGGALLSGLTLGFYSPWMAVKLKKIMTDNTRLGSQPFAYDGKGGELFVIWIKGLLLSIVTLGIYMFWMQAAMQRYHFEHTTLGGARFRFNLTGGHLFKIMLVQVFGTTFTLGIAFPWIATWTIRSLLEVAALEGQVDFDQIVQRAGTESAAGDALADALDVGLGV
jgi:uncharacterized membrane protein YjgN (DUF898 family)